MYWLNQLLHKSCKGSGFNYRNTQQFETRCLNAVNKGRSENMGLYRNDQRVACLMEWSWDTALQLDTRRYPRRQDLPRRTHRDQSIHDNMQQYDACNDMAIWVC